MNGLLQKAFLIREVAGEDGMYRWIDSLSPEQQDMLQAETDDFISKVPGIISLLPGSTEGLQEFVSAWNKILGVPKIDEPPKAGGM